MSENIINTNMLKEYISGEKCREWTSKETIANGLTGRIHIIPPACTLGVSLIIPASNSGKIQYSRSPRVILKKDLEEGTTESNWIDWEDGTITSSLGRTSFGSVTGIRAVSVSGDVTLEIVASSN